MHPDQVTAPYPVEEWVRLRRLGSAGATIARFQGVSVGTVVARTAKYGPFPPTAAMLEMIARRRAGEALARSLPSWASAFNGSARVTKDAGPFPAATVGPETAADWVRQLSTTGEGAPGRHRCRIGCQCPSRRGRDAAVWAVSNSSAGGQPSSGAIARWPGGSVWRSSLGTVISLCREAGKGSPCQFGGKPAAPTRPPAARRSCG